MNAMAPGPSTLIRVLLVDDSRAFLDVMERFPWGEAGLELVGCASSGEEALAAVKQAAPDLVLMDVAMPGMSGLAATVIIKSKSSAPRVIILTVNDAPEYREAAAGVGADGFVTKGQIGAMLLPAIWDLFPPGGASPAVTA